MSSNRRERFRGRHLPEEIIVLCVRWYLRYCLSYPDLEEMRAERGVEVDHSTIARWVLHFARLKCRCRPSPYLNNIIEQDHRFVKKRVTASQGFRSVDGVLS